MIQLLCACQTPTRWRCHRGKECEGCGALFWGGHWNRRFCGGCKVVKQKAANKQVARDALQRRHENIIARVRHCVVCSKRIEVTPRHDIGGHLAMRRLFCSEACSDKHHKQCRRMQIEALKLDTVQWAIHLEKKRTGGDPNKRALRRQRMNAAKRERNLVIRAVRELGLLEASAVPQAVPSST